MERLIVSPEGGIQDEDYLEDLLGRIEEAKVIVFANTCEGNPLGASLVTLRRIEDPRWLTSRWVVVVDSDSYVAKDYSTKREGLAAYREVVNRSEAEGVVWDVRSDR